MNYFLFTENIEDLEKQKKNSSMQERAEIAAQINFLEEVKKKYYENAKNVAFFPAYFKADNSGAVLKIFVSEDAIDEKTLKVEDTVTKNLSEIAKQFIIHYFEQKEHLLKIFEIKQNPFNLYIEFPQINNKQQEIPQIEGNSFHLAAFFAIISYLLDLIPIDEFAYTGGVNPNNFDILEVEGIDKKSNIVSKEFNEERKLISSKNYNSIFPLFEEVYGKITFENIKNRITRYLSLSITDNILSVSDFNLKMVKFNLIGEINSEYEIQSAFKLFEELVETLNNQDRFDGMVIDGRITVFLMGMLSPLFKNNSPYFVAVNYPTILKKCNKSEQNYKNAIVLVTPKGSTISKIGEIICFNEKREEK